MRKGEGERDRERVNICFSTAEGKSNSKGEDAPGDTHQLVIYVTYFRGIYIFAK